MNLIKLAAAVVIVAVAHAFLWAVSFESVSPPKIDRFSSLSYTPYRLADDPVGYTPPREVIEQDIEAISKVSGHIRMYSATAGLDAVPAIAEESGVRVMAGAWLDKDSERNRREIEAVVTMASANHNVSSVVVGNEVLLRREMSPSELVEIIKSVKAKVRQPVTTGETWHIWSQTPELARAVDFLAVHILPYWENVPAEMAVDYAIGRYEELKKQYPGKRIVIAEFGWPSDGYNRNGAVPDRLTQAQLLREFAAEADRRGIEYNLVEAFDQPWKTNEGSVGPHWGIFTADAEVKFDLHGKVDEAPWLLPLAAAAVLLGAFLSLLALWGRRITFAQCLGYSAAAAGVGACISAAALMPASAYMSPGLWTTWAVGMLMMTPLAFVALSKFHDIVEVLFGSKPERLLVSEGFASMPSYLPKVSVHVPAYRENPDMLAKTLDSVAALDYPNFECLVIVNNTPEPEYWMPVREHCERLGGRFKFVFLPKVSGFKAGAMNAALPEMAEDAEIIALIDADYVVHPNWLRDLVPAFADPKVGIVQAPQDHRDGNESVLKGLMKPEYDGFFDIGMVQRNEDDAIVAHGTMLMVRKSAFNEVGGWQTDTIVEDTELGLRLYEAGYSAHYTNKRYGWGVLPDTYKAFKTQRHRWAYGSVQIIKKHWKNFLPWSKTLTSAQKRRFVGGWFTWLSDSLGALVALLSIVWVPMIVAYSMKVPTSAMTIPVLALFGVTVVHSVLLYKVRVKSSLVAALAASVASMSLLMTVAKAVFDGVVRDGIPFRRTEKGGNSRRRRLDVVGLPELVVGTALAACSVYLFRTNWDSVFEVNLYATALAVQAVPFFATVFMRIVESVNPGLTRALAARKSRRVRRMLVKGRERRRTAKIAA